MDLQKKTNLAKAKKNALQKTAIEEENLRRQQTETLERFLSDLSGLLSKGIDIRGISDVDNVVSRIEQYAQKTADLVAEIARISATIPNLNELELPTSIELKQVTDESLVATLKEIGDQNELLQKLAGLDQAILLLKDVIAETPTPGQREEDYLPVRIVLGREGALRFLESWPIPQFTGATSDITAIKGFALGQYDTINATYPSATTELYTYLLNGATVATILVTYTTSAKTILSSVVKS